MQRVQSLARKSGKMVWLGCGGVMLECGHGVDTRTDVLRCVQIICSIHQPRATIFELFDRVMLLTRGEVAYYGRGSDALGAFAAVGFPCREHENPADFLIDVIVTSEGSGASDVLQKLVAQSTQALASLPAPHQGENLQLNGHSAHSSLLQQYLFLTQRNVMATIRTPVAFFAQLGQFIFMGLLLGLLYLGISDDQTGFQNRIGYLYFLTLNITFAYMPVLALFIEVRLSVS